MRGSITLKQVLINLKALVCTHWMQQWSVLNESANAYINPWPNLGTSHSDSNVYFKALALLNEEQKFHLLSADSKQAIIPKILLFSSLTLVVLLLDILECNLKPNRGMKPK
jgi:hypothetical protein